MPSRSPLRRVTGVPEGFPLPVGPYSPGVQVGGWLYLSGQIALSTEGTIIPGGVEAEARLIFERLGILLSGAGFERKDVVRLTLYMTDLSFFPVVNEACARFFREPYPARTTVGVSCLPRGASLEVDVIAFNPENGGGGT